MKKELVSGVLRLVGYLSLLVLQVLGIWLLWNAILPQVTGFSRISLLQAAGLLLLGTLCSGRLWLAASSRKRRSRVRDDWQLRWREMSSAERQTVINGGDDES